MIVVIGIDGSTNCLDAVDQACGLLDPQRDRLALYYSPPHIQRTIPLDAAIVDRGLAELTESILDHAVFHLPDAWKSRVQRIADHCDPASGILQTSEQLGADLIVVGTHGLGALGRLLLGSVSRKVVRSAAIPVLVARKRSPETKAIGHRVMLACESFATGKILAGVLNRFTWPSDAIVEVLHTVPSMFGGAIPNWLDAEARKPSVDEMVKLWVRHHDQRIAAARTEMESLDAELRPFLQPVPPTLVEGAADHEILNAACQHGSDLIVMGAKATTSFGRLASGSTCESVLNHASCSVLVVHH